MNELYLQHHGILGMKWGVRRFQPYPKGHIGGKEVGEAAKKKASAKKDNMTDAMREARSKDINKMTTQEIREYNNRLQAENQFLQLTKEKKSKSPLVSRGEKYASKFENQVANRLITAGATAVTTAALLYGKDFIKSFMAKHAAAKASTVVLGLTAM